MARIKNELIDQVIVGERTLNKSLQRDLAKEVKARRQADPPMVPRGLKHKTSPMLDGAPYQSIHGVNAEAIEKSGDAYRSGPVEAISELSQQIGRANKRISAMEERWRSMEQRYGAANIITSHEDSRRGKAFIIVGLVFMVACIACMGVGFAQGEGLQWLKATCAFASAIHLLGAVLCFQRATRYWPTTEECYQEKALRRRSIDP